METPPSHFAARVLSLLDRVEYRRAETAEEKAAIFAMRHEAYARDGTIERRPYGLFHDPMDETPNVWMIGVFIDGDLAGSLRLHISASVDAPLAATDVYADILTPHLKAGRTIIDGTRFASKLDYSRLYPEMPYIILRPSFLAEKYFNADFMTVACRVEHQAFYRRMFGCIPWAEPRQYPNLKRLMVFLGYDCQARQTAIYTRYPFYHSSEAERARLFHRSSNLSSGFSAVGKVAEKEFVEF